MTAACLSVRQLLGSTFSFQHLPLAQAAAILARHGFGEIELWGIAPHLDLFHAHDRKVAAVRAMLADHGLSVRIFTPEQVVYPVNIASGDADYRRESVQRFRRAADIAAALGARHLFLTAGRGYETEPQESAWNRAADSLWEIASYAADLSIRCLLEPLQRRESNILHNAADLRRMMDRIGLPNVDAVLDLVAMACAGDGVGDYLAVFGPHLGHVHIVDGTPTGHLVWGDGTLPLGDWITALAAAGYGGTMSFEPFGDGSYALDPEAALVRNLAAIRDHLQAEKTQA
jgi:protein FrlC